MSIKGHKTRVMFDRYNIVSEQDLTDAAEKVKAYRTSKRTNDSGFNPEKRSSG
jgi:hypothetical protein